MCSPLTLGGVQQCSGLVVVPTFLCPGISFFIFSSSLSDFVPSSHDHLVKMWDQRSHKTPLFELTGKKCSQCKTTLADFSCSFTTRRNVGKHRSNPIKKSDIMVWNVFTQATRTRFSVVTGPAVRWLTLWTNFWKVLTFILFNHCLPRWSPAVVLTTIWRSSRPRQGKLWRPATHDVKDLRPQHCDPDRACWLYTGTLTVQIHSFRAYKQNIRIALTISFKSLFSVS